jgi:hypothetical protein
MMRPTINKEFDCLRKKNLLRRVLGESAFALWWLYWAHIYDSFKGTGSTVVSSDIFIKKHRHIL